MASERLKCLLDAIAKFDAWEEAQQKQAELQPTDSQEEISQKVISLDCPKCGSGQTIRSGKGKPRKDGTRLQRILCKDCGRTSLIG
ncbi:MAG: hypothetical protein J0L70_23690 [Leptolyngbya sp. UWPOB_LEPTO1]|uniref:hypothetical protein n=1 Tax=Leptolyngbya sp. UWPOB_LEPTO1 TaxID=2815653 RepID=UPI001AC82486|nr:hypothetical protein [Leptolyngbya sp. UWPOB_LEPTO1]MBN8563546.1 hypothetical protein [Leptolyngbya sp. UWPOB_LEPTO1]